MKPEQIRVELDAAVRALPSVLAQDNRKTCVQVTIEQGELAGYCDREPLSVMRNWTHRLPLRHQGVLTTAIRGCDGAPKEDVSKSFSRMIRRAVLNPADHRETGKSGGFFGFDADRLLKDFSDFLHSLDQYPLHYVMHLCHAAQVIGYKHPDPEFKRFFALAYELIVHTFHLMPEAEAQMDERLTCDRVEAGTTERNF